MLLCTLLPPNCILAESYLGLVPDVECNEEPSSHDENTPSHTIPSSEFCAAMLRIEPSTFGNSSTAMLYASKDTQHRQAVKCYEAYYSQTRY